MWAALKKNWSEMISFSAHAGISRSVPGDMFGRKGMGHGQI
jgi:hypothetical protein